MTEAQSGEVERVLLHISDARDRTRRAIARVEKEGAEDHIVQALRQTQQELAELHRRLTQSTYYAVPKVTDQLAI